MKETHIPTNADVMAALGCCSSAAQKKLQGSRGTTACELVLMADELEIPLEPLARELATRRSKWVAKRVRLAEERIVIGRTAGGVTITRRVEDDR